MPMSTEGGGTEDLRAVDRREEDDTNVGRLERKRAAATAGTEPEAEREGSDHTDDGGAVRPYVGERGRVDGLVTEPARQEQGDGDPDDGSEVRAVGGLEPVEVLDPAMATRGAQFLQRLE